MRLHFAILAYFDKHYLNLVMFVKNFSCLFIFPMDTPYLLIRAISGLIVVESDSGLLLDITILNDSAPMAE